MSVWVGGSALFDFRFSVGFEVLGGLASGGKSHGTDGTANDLTTSVVP